MRNLLILFVCLFAAFSLEVATIGTAIIGLMTFKIPFMNLGSFNMAIPIEDAQGVFTKKLVAVYKEMPVVKSFLRSLFRTSVSMTKEISVAVQRGSETVAVDVFRYSDGNRNSFDKSTERVIVPPFYHEWMSVSEHRLYDQVITALSEGNVTFFAQMTQEMAEQLVALQNKIERATELQCAQVMQTGIVSMASGESIDFKRKAASIVAYNAANDFSISTVDPRKVLAAGAVFIRTKGKSQGQYMNAILGATALSDLLNNPKIQGSSDLRDINLGTLSIGMQQATGAVPVGELSCGTWKVRLWSYPEFYDVNGVSTPYIDDKKVVMFPDNPNFVMAYAAVPQLIKNGSIPQKGEYLVQEFLDDKRASHEVHIKSAVVAVPVAIDQLYTVTVKN
jgi:hypothetical protein